VQCQCRGLGHPKCAEPKRCADKPERSRGGNEEVMGQFLVPRVCEQIFGERHIAKQHIAKQGKELEPAGVPSQSSRTE
jgi:hypothetical protein